MQLNPKKYAVIFSKWFILLTLVLSPASFAFGQENSLAITVTPPLIQLTIGPGETWNSSLKVVNNNDYAVTYYAQIVNFEPQGEEGHGTFMPILGGDSEEAHSSISLASWVTLPEHPLFLEQGQSADIPFTVSIPTHAEPGGHYAAILIGTQPPAETPTGPVMKVSSYVTTLLFTKISGDVLERGSIREFYSDHTVYDEPKADFTLRFENEGNVHLQPKGDIIIYNMWGRERGRVDINKDTDFGIVLPQSMRKFDFSWEGAWNLYDLGRYRAEVTLTYGDEAKQNATAVTYFWLIPVVPVASVLIGVFVFILGIMWFVRRYIRRALELEAGRLRALGIATEEHVPHVSSISTFLKPLEEGVVDLRRLSGSASVMKDDGSTVSEHTQKDIIGKRSLTFFEFASKYKFFLLFVTFSIFFGWAFLYFFTAILESDRPYTISNVSTE